MVQPTQLLQDLGVVRVVLKDTRVRRLGRVVLSHCQQLAHIGDPNKTTHVLLLLMHMANLKPDVLFAQRLWWIRDDVAEALETESVHGYQDWSTGNLTSRLCWNFCCCL